MAKIHHLKAKSIESATDVSVPELSQTHHLKAAEEELKYITGKKGLDQFFQGIFGSPQRKPQIIDEIRHNFGLEKEEVIFVGDAISDYKGAKEAGVRFIIRPDPENMDQFENIEINESIKDLFDLEHLLISESSL